MQNQLRVYNSLSKKKEVFEPLNAPFVGMYVCGPTVYSDVHLGNVRTFLSFDIIYRYLKHLGYKAVVVNLSDVYAMNAAPRHAIISPAIIASSSDSLTARSPARPCR